jgi:hypothetical protein
VSVPPELLQPYVADFVDEAQARGALPGLSILAEKTGLCYDTIQRIWSGNARGTVTLEAADRILCAVNAVQAWYVGPLHEIYAAKPLNEVPVPKGRCQRRGCTKALPVKTWSGGLPQKYCSVACRNTASRWRYKRRIGRPVGRYSNPFDACVNGHDWSPENTYISPGGKRLCRQCMRDNQRRQRQRKKRMRQAMTA